MTPFVFTWATNARCLGTCLGPSVRVSLMVLLGAVAGLSPMLTGPRTKEVNRMRVELRLWACLFIYRKRFDMEHGPFACELTCISGCLQLRIKVLRLVQKLMCWNLLGLVL